MVLDDDERQSRRQMCFVPAHLITAWLGCAVVCGSRAQERHTLHGPPSLADEHLTACGLWTKVTLLDTVSLHHQAPGPDA